MELMNKYYRETKKENKVCGKSKAPGCEAQAAKYGFLQFTSFLLILLVALYPLPPPLSRLIFYYLKVILEDEDDSDGRYISHHI